MFIISLPLLTLGLVVLCMYRQKEFAVDVRLLWMLMDGMDVYVYCYGCLWMYRLDVYVYLMVANLFYTADDA